MPNILSGIVPHEMKVVKLFIDFFSSQSCTLVTCLIAILNLNTFGALLEKAKGRLCNDFEAISQQLCKDHMVLNARNFNLCF